MRPSQRWDLDAERVAKLRRAAEHLLELHDQRSELGRADHTEVLLPDSGSAARAADRARLDTEIADAEAATGDAAGPAAAVLERLGVWAGIRPLVAGEVVSFRRAGMSANGGWAEQLADANQQGGSRINPALGWSLFIPGDMFAPPSVLLDSVRAAEARCRSEADEARARESGLAGLVARFVRFPAEVRDAAGFTSEAGQRSAFIVGVAVQVVGTVIAAGVLAALSALVGSLL